MEHLNEETQIGNSQQVVGNDGELGNLNAGNEDAEN